VKNIIESAWEDRSLLKEEKTKNAIRSVIKDLDNGLIRVAEPTNNGWMVNEWVKKAVVLYFPIQEMKTIEAGPLEFHDKIPFKKKIIKKKELG
jgi:2,3,4,5-tetrahydropyridine-2-carboxylate N-succinyltransferase